MDDPCTSSVAERPSAGSGHRFGLMFYYEVSLCWDNARWLRSVPATQGRGYDPSLGRFAQADSIVPGGVQGLDRYAYINNAPTRFTDPSGHKPCGELIDGNCDRFIPRSLAGVEREILSRHGVTLSDEILKWDYNNAVTVLIALTQTDTAFKTVCSQGGVAGCGTKSIFGGQSLYIESGDPGEWGGWWSNGKLKFHGNFPPELVLHEIAHIFDTLAGYIPSSFLENDTVSTADGQYVAGVTGGSFQRSEIGYQITWRTKYMTGYKIGNQNVYTQLHPPSWASVDPAGEEFADMFMNFVMGTFASNSYGLARMDWMVTNMTEFITAAGQQLSRKHEHE